MNHGLDKLASDLKLLRKNIDRNSVTVVRKTAINIGSSIIMGTPWDTGKARGNWQTSLDTPILSTIDRLDLSGRGEAFSELGTVAMQFTHMNKSINLTNNLPYIHRLNTGWSKKAAPGYIERVIEAGKAEFPEDYLLKENQND